MNIDHLTAAAIARRTGVGRAAVSNWRRRYVEFPAPVEDGPSPLYSWAEVLAWLVATGKADQLVTAGQTDTGTRLVDVPWPATIAPREEMAAKPSPAQLLARAMVALLPEPGETTEREPTLLDPACGDGERLLAAADRFGEHVVLVGQDADESATAATAAGLRHHLLAPCYDLQTGDVLAGGHPAAAFAVVCLPPGTARSWPAADPRWRFGVPDPADADLAWVQHCCAQLRPRGVAVVGVSARTASRPSGRSIRAALVRAGVLRDVIALPRELGAEFLWVLRRASASDPGAVRMVDLTALSDPVDIPQDASAWRQLFADTDPARVRHVPRLELLDGDTGLLPSRYLAAPQAPVADDLARLTGRVRALYERIGAAFPPAADGSARADRELVTLAELERTGALTIRARDTTPRAGDVLLRTMGRPPVVAQGTETDGAGIAQVVEIEPALLDPHFVAMFLRSDAGALPVANTHGALNRDDLRRCRVPRMAFAEQRRYGAAFRHVLELQSAVSALAAVSVTVLDQTVHGLTTGALVPRPPVARETIAADARGSELP